MSKVERFILKQLKNEHYVITAHARKRMSERYISDADIVEVACNCSKIEKQDDNQTYLIKGKSCWGERMAISVAVRDNIIIVTVFYEGDKL